MPNSDHQGQIQLFENSDFGKIRVIIKDGNPWFIANEICRKLELTNSRVATRDLYEYEKGVSSIYTPGGLQQMTIISESGFYKLVLKSRKPEVRRFQDWVTQEVLPSIRKTGNYSIQNSNDNHILKALEIVTSKLDQLAIENKEIRQELQVMKPKVQFYDLYVESDQIGVDCKTAAKIIGKMGRNRLFAFLRRKNLIMYDNMPYQKYVDLGLFSIKYSKTGFPVLLITKKGVEKIGQLLGQ